MDGGPAVKDWEALLVVIAVLALIGVVAAVVW
jgi:hypothetical protein